MKKEIKIGIYAVVILLAAWAGIRFLSGIDVLGRSRTYTAHYANVDGLQDAAAVTINGVKVTSANVDDMSAKYFSGLSIFFA
jgi:phospholipid/cholesterol/gamma-HCH transport system substrate-binding protein